MLKSWRNICNMKHRILISEAVAQNTIDFLTKNNIEVKFGSGLDENTIINEIADCDAVMVRVMKISKKILDKAPNLKIIAKHGVGFDSIDIEEAKKRNIPVVYSPGANAQSVAEHTMSLILGCARHLKEMNNVYADGDYGIKNKLSFYEIKDKTLLLIGFGNIARLVAKMAYYGFDMKVIAYDTNPVLNEVPKYVEIADELYDAIKTADFVSVHIPGNAENYHMIDYKFFEKMKSTAFLINTARGSIVNPVDLEEAIRGGKIAGAGLDVCEPEPAPKDSFLLSDNRVILTPHCGASSQESMIRMGIMAAQGVVDFFEGRELKHVVY